ncbi:hypothetical protein BW34_02571 [Microbacterium oleivorans]|uniref:Uncharacterized protein n=1 Tax=Microbacterium oleivorans TaxID=273677 RepID=A0A031FN32_9MICO|nr:hypothetical protein BW34_02571 [Microbacterium oleivorans]
MNVRVERTRAPVLQLDDFEPSDVSTDASAPATTRVQLALPEQDGAVAHAVLQQLELLGELRVEERCDAVGLREVDGPIQKQVGVLRSVHGPA